MEDASKAHKLKLANSRKRFKELQELKKKKNETTEIEQTDKGTSIQLPNYFTNSHYTDNSVFFDTISRKNKNPENETNYPSVNDIEINHERPTSSMSEMVKNIVKTPSIEDRKYSLFNQNNQQSYIKETQQIIHPHQEPICIDYPEIQQNEIFELHKNSDLQELNIELDSQLKQQQLKLDELESKLSNYEQQEISLNKIKEELLAHSQTIRLLVTEKSELSSNIAQLELNFQQKNAENEELQARLKASRSRAFELEQELNQLKNEKSKKDNSGLEKDEIVIKLRENVKKIDEDRDEMKQDLLEIKEKLRNSEEECLKLVKLNGELGNKLNLAEVKIQQLSGDNNEVSVGEKLATEKNLLEKELMTSMTMLKSVTKERDELTSNYQHYTEELNSQLATLQESYTKLQLDNENLIIQEQNRIRHISELERQLQNSSSTTSTTTTGTTADSKFKNELEVTRELCIQLQMEKTELDEQLTKSLNEKEMLLKELSSKNDSLNELEIIIEELRGNQPDNVKLLKIMESDKIAATKAVQQNKELKEQLESVQQVFAKLDNDKVELTEKYQSQLSSNRDLLEKLQKTELQLSRLHDAIDIKDRELSILRENCSESEKKLLQNEQLIDKLRHYEAQNNSSNSLQNELTESKKTISLLNNEIINLKNQKNVNNELLETNNKIDQLNKELKELHSNNDEECLMMEKEEAMKCLEEKVKKTMQEIADLSEEKQRLEHLVLQLQSETETIGEYVALYQHQRMILKQKALEKDEQLKQLASDREQIKAKLDKLNKLVSKLISNKEDDLVENKQDKEESEEEVEEIINLLSEIKTSNLVEPKETVHHCPYCSGQLLTV